MQLVIQMPDILVKQPAFENTNKADQEVIQAHIKRRWCQITLPLLQYRSSLFSGNRNGNYPETSIPTFPKGGHS